MKFTPTALTLAAVLIVVGLAVLRARTLVGVLLTGVGVGTAQTIAAGLWWAGYWQRDEPAEVESP